MSTAVGKAAGRRPVRLPRLRRGRLVAARLAGAEDAWSRLVSLGAFAALAGFCAGHWGALVKDPPTFRVIAAVAIATGAGAALAAIGGLPRSRASAAARAVAPIAALAAALVTIGLPARLLLPGGLDELGGGLARGLAGLHTIDWPYAGPDGWVRLAILLAIPATLCTASALAFWPTGRHRPRLRAAALVSLVALYGVAVAQLDPGEPLARGAVLLALVAAWLFGPGVSGRAAPAATAMVLVAAAVALPLAARLPAGEPLVDYSSWRWLGEPAIFSWEHSYGPIDWPREGETVLTIESERPHYWKAMALDRFDGFRWERSEGAAGSGPDPAAPTTNPRRWETEVSVTVESLHSDLLVSPGSIRQVEGAGVATLTRDGAAHADEELDQGSTYTVRAYAPNPTAERLRRAPELDPRVVQPYTLLHLPPAEGDDASSELGPGVVLPRFSDGLGGTVGAKRALLSSPYADVYKRARRLVEGAPTAYDAVRRIEVHLREEYAYSEQPPARDYPLTGFLLEDRIGYCQQFSGAMALMLRMNGIPARVATGFSPGLRDRSRDEFTVRDLDAHSWVEVHFAGTGWVPFDPTPPAAPAASRADETLASAARGNLGLAGSELPAPGGAGQLREEAPTGARPPGGGEVGNATRDRPTPGVAGVAMAALVLLALAGAILVWRRAEQGPDAPVAELRRALERLGHPVAPGTTLADVERRLREAGHTGAARHVRRMSERRFARPGRPPPDARGRRALRAALTAGSDPLGRARGYVVLPPHLGNAGGRTPGRRRARLAGDEQLDG